MKRKFFLIISAVAVMIFAGTVTAGAEIYCDEDFSDSSFLSDNTKITYTVESNPPAGEESVVEIVNEDRDVTGDGVPDGTEGTFHMKNTVSASGMKSVSLYMHFPAEFRNNSGESIFMYDLMLPNVTSFNTSDAVAMMYYGGVRHNSYFRASMFYSSDGSVATGHVAGQWYTYMYRLNKEKTIISIYRKLQSEPDSSFKLLGTTKAGSHNAGPYFYWLAYNGRKTDVYLDNMKLYSGTNILSQEFILNGGKVTEVSALAEGELEAKISFLSNIEKTGLHKFLVAYDKNDKLLGCTVAQKRSESFIFGHNEIAAKMNLDAESAAALADGGYVGLYVWDGLNPVMVPLELY